VNEQDNDIEKGIIIKIKKIWEDPEQDGSAMYQKQVSRQKRQQLHQMENQ
jgi:hypothetical protein